jgi:hypothetical protein
LRADGCPIEVGLTGETTAVAAPETWARATAGADLRHDPAGLFTHLEVGHRTTVTAPTCTGLRGREFLTES